VRRSSVSAKRSRSSVGEQPANARLVCGLDAVLGDDLVALPEAALDVPRADFLAQLAPDLLAGRAEEGHGQAPPASVRSRMSAL
jgi:hypothetical protein